MSKILIADSDTNFAHEIIYYLNQKHDVQIVNNNKDLHQSLFNLPDCIIANYDLCYHKYVFLTDNLFSIAPLNNTILYILAEMNLKSACNVLCEYKIDHFTLLPVNPQEVSLYAEYLIKQKHHQIENYEIIRKNQIEHVLICMGVYPNRLSTKQLSESLFLCVRDSSYLYSVTKQLYPEIAARFMTTSAAVERNLRSAIQLAINNNSNLFQSLFPNTSRIKNQDFLFIVAKHIRSLNNQPILV